MIYALKERIGNPSLFCGRKQEMKLLLNWVDKIKIERANALSLVFNQNSHSK